MSKRSRDLNEARCLAAATLMLKKGWKQTEIATWMKASTGTVSKLIRDGEGKYWREGAKEEGPMFSSVPEEVQREANALINRQSLGHRDISALADAKSSNLLSVRVVPCNLDKWLKKSSAPLQDHGLLSEEDWQSWLATLGRLAMPRVIELLADGKTWGVTWGSQIEAVISAIAAECRNGRRLRRDMRVVPLCGSRCGARLFSESSSALAEVLQLALTGRVDAPVSIGQVPAFILGDMSESEARALWKHIVSAPAWLEAFGAGRLPAGLSAELGSKLGARISSSTPLVHALDGVLTAVSSDGHPFGYGPRRMYADAGYQLEEIQAHYSGDLGGIGLLHAGQAPHTVLESRWTGILREDLLAVAERAARKEPGEAVGVVLVASGSDRVKSVLESVRLGYVSHLIIDESLIEAFTRLLDARAWMGPRLATADEPA